MSALTDFAKRSPFLAAVATMMSGTAISQVIPLAIAPVLTRLYTAEDYGHYALFMLVSYTISAFASLRYETAIMLPTKETDAGNVLAMCFVIAVVVSGAVLISAITLDLLHMDVLGSARLGRWKLLLPLMIFLQSTYQSLSYWLIRKRAFAQLSTSRVFRAVAMAGFNLSFGFLHLRGGLIVSSAIGQLIATIVLLVRLRRDRIDFSDLNRKIMRREAIAHRHFPLFALPADLLSTFSQQLPLTFFDAGPGGYFAFVQNVVNAPTNFVAGAVLDAFKERATREYRERGEFRAIFVRLARWLALISIVPALVLAFFGPILFATVFGAKWREGGEMARILSVVVFFKLIVSPLSYSYYIVNKQREDFILHILVCLLVAGALAYGELVAHSDHVALVGFTIAYSLVYVVYFVRSYTFSGGTKVRAPAT